MIQKVYGTLDKGAIGEPNYQENLQQLELKKDFLCNFYEELK